MAHLSQIQLITNYLDEHGKITQRNAHKFGCDRLSARIADMRAMGIPIRTEMKTVKKRNGGYANIAVYMYDHKTGCTGAAV